MSADNRAAVLMFPLLARGNHREAAAPVIGTGTSRAPGTFETTLPGPARQTPARRPGPVSPKGRAIRTAAEATLLLVLTGVGLLGSARERMLHRYLPWLSCSLVGCVLTAVSDAQEVRTSGEQVYRRYCASCHDNATPRAPPRASLQKL